MIMKSTSLTMKQAGMRAFALSACNEFPFAGFEYRKQHYMIIGTADGLHGEWLFEIKALWHSRRCGGAVFMPQKYDTWRIAYKQFHLLCHEWGLCDCTTASGLGDIQYPIDMDGYMQDLNGVEQRGANNER